MGNSTSHMRTLENRILQLEKQQAQQMAELKISGSNIVQSFTPANMLKSAFQDIKSTPGLRATALDTAIGIGTGFISRKLMMGRSNSIFRKIAGNAVQFLVTNLVRKKIPQIRENRHHSNGNAN